MSEAWPALLRALALAAALVLGVMALLVAGDVLARNIGLGTLPWIVEVSEYSLPLATFLVAPWLLARNEHVRLDVLVTAVPKAFALWLERLADVLGLAICAIFVIYGARVVADSAGLGAMVLKSVVFPEWWLFAPVPGCFALLAIEFLRRLVRPAAPVKA